MRIDIRVGQEMRGDREKGREDEKTCPVVPLKGLVLRVRGNVKVCIDGLLPTPPTYQIEGVVITRVHVSLWRARPRAKDHTLDCLFLTFVSEKTDSERYLLST